MKPGYYVVAGVVSMGEDGVEVEHRILGYTESVAHADCIFAEVQMRPGTSGGYYLFELDRRGGVWLQACVSLACFVCQHTPAKPEEGGEDGSPGWEQHQYHTDIVSLACAAWKRAAQGWQG